LDSRNLTFAVRCEGQGLEGRARQILTRSSQSRLEFVRKSNRDVSHDSKIIASSEEKNTVVQPTGR
jgi:hypothetical protein